MESDQINQQLGYGNLYKVTWTDKGYTAIYVNDHKRPVHELTFNGSGFTMEDLSPKFLRFSTGETLGNLMQQHFSERSPQNDYELHQIFCEEFSKYNLRWTPDSKRQDAIYVPAGLIPGLYVPLTGDNIKKLQAMVKQCQKPDHPLKVAGDPGLLIMLMYQQDGRLVVQPEWTRMIIFAVTLANLRKGISVLFDKKCISKGSEYALMVRNNLLFNAPGNSIVFPGDQRQNPNLICFGYFILEEGVTEANADMERFLDLFYEASQPFLKQDE